MDSLMVYDWRFNIKF